MIVESIQLAERLTWRTANEEIRINLFEQFYQFMYIFRTTQVPWLSFPFERLTIDEPRVVGLTTGGDVSRAKLGNSLFSLRDSTGVATGVSVWTPG